MSLKELAQETAVEIMSETDLRRMIQAFEDGEPFHLLLLEPDIHDPFADNYHGRKTIVHDNQKGGTASMTRVVPNSETPDEPHYSLTVGEWRED